MNCGLIKSLFYIAFNFLLCCCLTFGFSSNIYAQNCAIVEILFPGNPDTLFVCKDNAPVDLSAFVLGGTGTFVVDGIQSDQITFDPDGLNGGYYSVVYTEAPNTCQKIIAVVDFDLSKNGQERTICKDADPIGLEQFALPIGGEFSGSVNNGAVSSSNSTFTPFTAGPGPYTINYTLGTAQCGQQIFVGNIRFDLSPNKRSVCPFDEPVDLVYDDFGTTSGFNVDPPFGTGTFFGGSAGIVNGSDFNPSLAGSGIHQIFYTNGVDTCWQTITVESFEVQAALDPIPNEKLCSISPPVTIQGNGLDPTLGYFFLNETTNLLTNDNSFEFNPADYPEGNYDIIYFYLDSGTNGNGCISYDTISVEISSNIANISMLDTVFCESEKTFPINISPEGGNLYATDPNVVILQDGPSLDIMNSEPGTYWLYYEYIDTVSACSGTDSINVKIEKGLEATFTVETSSCSNIADRIFYTGEALPDSAVLTWSVTDYILESTEDDSLFFELDWEYPGNYDVVLKIDSVACTAFGDVKVFEVEDRFEADCQIGYFIPNVFTPNGDTNNEVFNIKGDGLIEMDLKIFDRWGNQIFATADQLDGWDGTFEGKELPTGVFFYSAEITFEDGSTKIEKGNVTLLR